MTKVGGMRIWRWCLLSLAILGIVTACRTVSMQNVVDYDLGAPNSASMEDVAQAIKAAGAGLGWQMKEIAPGEMLGTLNIRRHVAIVTIVYDTRIFSITYKDSSGLGYNGNTIHKNYNSWTNRLAKMIAVQASSI